MMNKTLCARRIRSLAATLLLAVAAAAVADSEIVIINGDRIFTVDEFTEYFLDGESIPAKFFQQVGTGKPGAFSIKSGANETLTTGLLERIELFEELRGPVTSTSPLTVFRQPMILTDRTRVSGVPGGLAALEVGTEVVVSGLTSRRNARRVTRIDLDLDDESAWQLVGYVSDVTDEGFRIGLQPVRYNGVTPEACSGGLADGDFVRVRAQPAVEFLRTVVLETTISIRCLDRRIDTAPDGVIPGSVDGLVTERIDDETFRVGRQPVRLTAATEFRNGDEQSITLGVRVEVQGPLDTATGELTARLVEFQEVRFRLAGPVTPDAVTPGESIRLLGVTLQADAATEDPAGLLSLGLAKPTQIEARGYRDGDGGLVLSQVRPIGRPDAGNVAIRGPVTSVARPELTILGVRIDTSAAVFEQNDTPIDADSFFAAVVAGSQVSVRAGVLEPATGVVAAGTVELAQAEPGGGRGDSDGRGAGIGIVTLSQDCVFVSGFEGDPGT